MSGTLLTIDTELKHLRENLGEMRQEVRELFSDVKDVRERLARLEESGTTAKTLEGQMADVRERLARLEESRESDRAQIQADLSRFKAEVERAEIRLSRMLPKQGEQPELPEQGE
jgi:chromosome segregation ATPase